ncbi:hypothetical protein P167DRAFT_608835 [Morchella conica CCBAS932]|uniref:Rhodopsin domain-containing protein n=2 Tax=Morchella sect. Distantes TaxID=1051054 RepID=A0A3N4KFS4_9PEZI|nr:hypothetical protein P167DRAFT_608835 [Morchella conica CCBAS932]
MQIMFAKLSLLFFYLRIGGPRCGGLPTWFRISTIMLIALTIVVGVISEVIIIFQCKPANHQWNRLFPGADPDGKCWDLVVFYFVHAGLNIFLDVVITILPMPLLLSLELPRRQKIGLCGLFSLGGVVCIISLVRVVKLPALNKSKDITWDITDAIVWYYVESTLIVIAACGPSLKPLIRKYVPGLLGSSTPESSGIYQGQGSNCTTHRVGRRFVEDVIAPLPPGNQTSTHITSSKDRSFYGECDSEERIIQEEIGMGIMKRTDVVMTVESQSEIDLTISRDTLPDAESGIRLEVLSSSNVYVENSKANLK